MDEINKFFKTETSFVMNKNIILNGGLTKKMFDQIEVRSSFETDTPYRPGENYVIYSKYTFDFWEVLGYVTIERPDYENEKIIRHDMYCIYTLNNRILKFDTESIRKITNINLKGNFEEEKIKCENDFSLLLLKDYETICDENDDENCDDTKPIDEFLTERSVEKLVVIIDYYKYFLKKLDNHKSYLMH